MVNIGFYFQPSRSWMAGRSLLQAYVWALRSNFGGQIRCTALVEQKAKARFRELENNFDDALYLPSPGSSSRLGSLGGQEGNFLKRHGVHARFGFNLKLQESVPPTFSWIPDFQYAHLPQAFSGKERSAVKQLISESSEASTRVIVMSEAVRKDFDMFVPEYKHKVRVVPPVTFIEPSVFETAPEFIAARYHLPERYVYCPNQFWKHKNHETLFRAVRILKNASTPIHLVLSGLMFDRRHPEYVSELFAKMSSWGIRDRIHCLGFIPRDHVFQLIRQSCCVVNASLFEGFGLSADEAACLGKNLLLSDVPSHREQNPPGTVYFDPHDEKKLASELKSVWETAPTGPHTQMEAEARRTYPLKLRRSAEAFMAAIKEVS